MFSVNRWRRGAGKSRDVQGNNGYVKWLTVRPHNIEFSYLPNSVGFNYNGFLFMNSVVPKHRVCSKRRRQAECSGITDSTALLRHRRGRPVGKLKFLFNVHFGGWCVRFKSGIGNMVRKHLSDIGFFQMSLEQIRSNILWFWICMGFVKTGRNGPLNGTDDEFWPSIRLTNRLNDDKHGKRKQSLRIGRCV